MTVNNRCSVCGRQIPADRLEAMPDTEVCVRHSRVRPKTEYDVEVDSPDPADIMNSVDTPTR